MKSLFMLKVIASSSKFLIKHKQRTNHKLEYQIEEKKFLEICYLFGISENFLFRKLWFFCYD